MENNKEVLPSFARKLSERLDDRELWTGNEVRILAATILLEILTETLKGKNDENKIG